MKKLMNIFAVSAMALMLSGASAGVIIDFETDPLGFKANDFISDDSALLSFADSIGADLEIIEGPMINGIQYEIDGRSLAVEGDFDDSYLVMNFSVVVKDLAVDFGNDDPGFANPGDKIILTLYLNGVEVGQTFVEMTQASLDDLMNQSIGINDIAFNKATLRYDVTLKDGLTEVVDNIEFTVVPEPATLVLLALGGVMLRKSRE